MATVKIGNRLVGYGHPCFVIAEIGINHNGSVAIAKRLIDVAVEAGCDAVKFQKRMVTTVYTEKELATPRAFDQSIIDHAMERLRIEGASYPVFGEGTLSTLERLKQDPKNTTNGDLKYALEFGPKEYEIIHRYCKNKGITWFASSWDGISTLFINGFVPCHKIASACLTHRDLLKRTAEHGKPVILSTGGSTMEQVQEAVKCLDRDNLIILHCTATYPSKDEEANLSVLDAYRVAFPGIPVGYSGHELGHLATLAAVARGACVVERHITLDRAMPGSDQKASLEPEEFKEMVSQIRRIEIMLGDGVKKVFPSEVPIMEKLRRVKDF